MEEVFLHYASVEAATSSNQRYLPTAGADGVHWHMWPHCQPRP